MSKYKQAGRHVVPHAVPHSMKYTAARHSRHNRRVRRRQARLFIITLLAVAIIGYIAWPQSKVKHNKPVKAPGLAQPNKPVFNKKSHSLVQAGSLWWIVSKARPIQPPDYAPVELVNPSVPFRLNQTDEEMRVQKEVETDLEAMFMTARKEGVNLMLISGFRSYAFQSNVYNQTIHQLGEAKANEVSAPPGTSEHQTGLAVDIGSADRRCEVEVCFGEMPEGKWLAAHAYEYGFNLRYPNGKTTITGYTYEPWHFRYVGKELAAEMQRLNIQTLEEFFAEELKV